MVAIVDMPRELKAMLYNRLLVVAKMCVLVCFLMIMLYTMLLKGCVDVLFYENVCYTCTMG